MKTKYKRIGQITAAVLVLAVMGAVLLMLIRPDLRFRAMQSVYSITSNARLEKISEGLSLQRFEAKDLKNKNFTINQSMMLVNQNHRLDSDFTANIKEYKKTGVMLNECALNSFRALSDNIKAEYGENLLVMSSYRTAKEQAEIESEQGSDTAMPAGSSEHQTGLGADLYFEGYAGGAIIKTDAGRYLNSQCGDYGFIIRYPEGKKSVTGIDYEPWHLRYVGLPHSKFIMENHITLEEYFDLLEYGKFYEYENYIISRQKGDTLDIPESGETVISPDNCGGYVITVKTE